MAVVYTKQPSTTSFLNAFNNNLMVFNDDGVKTPEKAVIYCAVNAEVVELTITPFGDEFEFNFVEVSSYFAKKNKFRDGSTATIGAVQDNDNKLSMDVDITITFTDATTVNATTETYLFFRTVSQVGNVFQPSESSNILLNKSNLTFFKGFPFDVAFYNKSTSLTVKNLVNLNQETFSGLAADNIYRFYFSRGDLLVDSDFFSREEFVRRIEALSGGEIIEGGCYTYPTQELLKVGLNRLRLLISGEPINLNIQLEDDSCGIYLKWINEYGTWSYWLFSSVYVEALRSRAVDTYIVQETDINDTYETELITGVLAQDVLDLRYKNATASEVEQIKSLMTSPRIMLYNGTYETNPSTLSQPWQTVTLATNSMTVADKKYQLTNINIQITKNRYTQV